MTPILHRRYAWGRHLTACVIAGAAAAVVWPDTGAEAPELRQVLSAALWLICARRFACAWMCATRVLEIRRLRKRANKQVAPYNEARLELLVSADHPDVEAILAEQQKLRDELDRSAAKRRLMLLEAGVNLPKRWRTP